MTVLDGAWLKLGRADRHFDELQANIPDPPFQTDAVRFAQEFGPKSSTIQITLENVPKLPAEWGLVVSDILQNLRTALNYVAWECARWDLARRGKTRDPVQATQFPIEYKRWRGVNAGQIADIQHPELISRIEASQPNSAANLMADYPETFLQALPDDDARAVTSSHPLTQLALLTNEDKHRILLPVGVGSGPKTVGKYKGINCTVDHVNIFLMVALENGAKWAELKVTPTGRGEPKVQVNDDIGQPVVFIGSTMTQIGMLVPIRNAVAEIIAEFEPPLA